MSGDPNELVNLWHWFASTSIQQTKFDRNLSIYCCHSFKWRLFILWSKKFPRIRKFNIFGHRFDCCVYLFHIYCTENAIVFWMLRFRRESFQCQWVELITRSWHKFNRFYSMKNQISGLTNPVSKKNFEYFIHLSEILTKVINFTAIKICYLLLMLAMLAANLYIYSNGDSTDFEMRLPFPYWYVKECLKSCFN